MNELSNYKAVYRTAPPTPGLLTTMSAEVCNWHPELKIRRNGTICTNWQQREQRRQDTGILVINNLFINFVLKNCQKILDMVKQSFPRTIFWTVQCWRRVEKQYTPQERQHRQKKKDIRKKTVDSIQKAVDSRQQTVDSIQKTVDGRKQTVNSSQQTVDSRQQTVDSRLYQHFLDLVWSCCVGPCC